MNYLEKTKSEGEDILNIFNISGWIYIYPIVEILFATFILILISLNLLHIPDGMDTFFSKKQIISGLNIGFGFLLLKGIYDFLYLKTLNMGITSERIVLKKGILSRKTNEIELDAVERVFLEQSIAGVLFNYGDVYVTGRGEGTIVFEGIDNPLEIKKEISSILKKYGTIV